TAAERRGRAQLHGNGSSREVRGETHDASTPARARPPSATKTRSSVDSSGIALTTLPASRAAMPWYCARADAPVAQTNCQPPGAPVGTDVQVIAASSRSATARADWRASTRAPGEAVSRQAYSSQRNGTPARTPPAKSSTEASAEPPYRAGTTMASAKNARPKRNPTGNATPPLQKCTRTDSPA